MPKKTDALIEQKSRDRFDAGWRWHKRTYRLEMMPWHPKKLKCHTWPISANHNCRWQKYFKRRRSPENKALRLASTILWKWQWIPEAAIAWSSFNASLSPWTVPAAHRFRKHSHANSSIYWTTAASLLTAASSISKPGHGAHLGLIGKIILFSGLVKSNCERRWPIQRSTS